MLERTLRRRLGIPLRLSVVCSPPRPGESRRAHSKRLGRLARRNLRGRHRSLSHSGTIAVAVATSAKVAGIGVDFELDRPMKEHAGRFFLTKDERRWVRQQPTPKRAAALLRLWTIKEALYKANPENFRTSLVDHRLRTPGRWTGTANVLGRTQRYASLRFRGGFITVAVSAPEIMKDGYLTQQTVERLAEWLPALRQMSHVTPAQLFGQITVETLCIIVERKLQGLSRSPA